MKLWHKDETIVSNLELGLLQPTEELGSDYNQAILASADITKGIEKVLL